MSVQVAFQCFPAFVQNGLAYKNRPGRGAHAPQAATLSIGGIHAWAKPATVLSDRAYRNDALSAAGVERSCGTSEPASLREGDHDEPGCEPMRHSRDAGRDVHGKRRGTAQRHAEVRVLG